MKNEELFNKYKIEHADGTPTDPGAVYFVLRIDDDNSAVNAVIGWAIKNSRYELANDLVNYKRRNDRSGLIGT